MSGRRSREKAASLVPILFLLAAIAIPSTVTAGPVEDLTVGEAFYMVGNLVEASVRLHSAAQAGEPSQARRALYLLGRISLLTGDFRQAKEYFERAAEYANGSREEWMAIAGIGDALYAGGVYDEAVRRYRLAQGRGGGDVEKAIIGLKMALCERALGEEEKARVHLRQSLERIPVLSGWVGREEEFYHSMSMAGIDIRQEGSGQIYVVAGPVKGIFKSDGIVSVDTPVREIREGGKTFLEFGPLTDSVEAMILSQSLKNRLGVPVEVISR